MKTDFLEMGKRISERRKNLGVKQNTFAKEIGISPNYLSGIERGKETPSLEVFVAICNALKVTPDYLLMGSMYSNNVPRNIIDGLRICSKEDIEVIEAMVKFMSERRSKVWNDDNYI